MTGFYISTGAVVIAFALGWLTGRVSGFAQGVREACGEWKAALHGKELV